MLVKTAAWDETAGPAAHDALTTETKAIDFTVQHRFKNAAVVTVECYDIDGSLTQKYNGDSGDCYIGTGRMYIEEPTGTPLFDGRIIAAKHDTTNNRLTLLCKDWLSQLEDEDIIYDMREVLGSDTGGTYRQGTLNSHLPSLSDKHMPVFSLAGDYYLWDSLNGDRGWAENQWNGYFVVIPQEAVGYITSKTGPYYGLVYNEDNSTVDGARACWEDDFSYFESDDNDSDYYGLYYFRMQHIIGDTIVLLDKVKVNIVLSLKGDALVDATLAILNHNTAAYDDFTGGYWQADEVHPTRSTRFSASFDIDPDDFIDDYVDEDGQTRLRIYVNNDTPVASSMNVDELTIETFFYAQGVSDVITVTDTIRDTDDAGTDGLYVTLKVDTDCAEDGLGLWEGCPYVICDYIKNHVNGLVTARDPFVTLDTSIEATTGISSRRFEGMNTMYILNQLSIADQTVFWCVLGDATPTLKWVQTFGADVATLTDANVLSWSGGDYDIQTVFNEAHVVGARIGESQLYLDTSDLGTDPGAASKLIYGTRSTTIVNQGLTTLVDATQFGTAFVETNQAIKLHLNATIAGLYAQRLGDVIAITSTKLGLSDVDYVITDWSFNYQQNRTTIRLQPKTSLGYTEHLQMGEFIRDGLDKVDRVSKMTYVPGPIGFD